MDILNTISSTIISLFMLVSTAFSQQVTITSQNPQTNQQTTPSVTTTPAANSDISRNWAGYTTTGGKFTGVSGTWIVPQVHTTGSQGADATWVGVGGVASNDLIQAGTQATVDRFGQVSYSAFYETLPNASQPLNLPVNQGDSMSVSVNKLSGNMWNITVKNNTQGQSANVRVSYDSSLSSAEWIEEAPSGIQRVLPLDNFGTVQISDAKTIENGQVVTAEESGARPIAMSNATGITLAQASILQNNGTSFAVSRTNTSQTTAGQESSGPVVIYRIPHGQGGISIFRVHRHFRFY